MVLASSLSSLEVEQAVSDVDDDIRLDSPCRALIIDPADHNSRFRQFAMTVRDSACCALVRVQRYEKLVFQSCYAVSFQPFSSPQAEPLALSRTGFAGKAKFSRQGSRQRFP